MLEPASPLLQAYLAEIRQACSTAPALDLACGSGRNGLFLLRSGVDTEFADIRSDALRDIRAQAKGQPGRSSFWEVDLEAPGAAPLDNRQYGAVLVFRYLHRPLLGAIKTAVKPGGLVIYETFTVEQPRYGRPKNPDFLLQPGELTATFDGWEVLEYWEGVSNKRASAHLVARRPL